MTGLDLDLAALRKRTSEKWKHYPPDVLPVFVAETDFPIAEEIVRRLHSVIDDGDLGYAVPGDLGKAYASFANRRYALTVEPSHVRPMPEVMVAIAEILRVICKAGDAVIINPPVYPPFFSTIREVGCRVAEAPLRETGGRFEFDFDALEREMANGDRAFLLCNPHNPVGRVYGREDLERVASLAKQYDAIVLSDEIHAPLTLPGTQFVPFALIAAQHGVKALTLTSASKGWNVPGLKCAVAVAGDEWGRAILDALPKAMTERTGHLGVIATTTAFIEGIPYLDRVVQFLDRQRYAMREILDAAGLQCIGYTPPEASFLAWLDCRELGLGDDPAREFLKRGRVALNPGPAFGSQGAGFARFNFATSTEIIKDAVHRMKAAISNIP